MIKPRPNVLIVCGQNKCRSRTAEYIFKNDDRFAIRSVGLSPKSNRKINEKDITWAGLILVMTRDQKRMILSLYRNAELPQIEVLGIEDRYAYLDQELIGILSGKVNDTLSVIYGI
jgi:protein-tyrosine phosphatase